MQDSVPVREYRGTRDFDDRYDFVGQRPGSYMDMPDYPMARDYGRPVSRDYTPPPTGRRYSPDMRLSVHVRKVIAKFGQDYSLVLNTFAARPIFPWVSSRGRTVAEVSAGYLLWCWCTAELHVLNDEYTRQWHLPMHIN